MKRTFNKRTKILTINHSIGKNSPSVTHSYVHTDFYYKKDTATEGINATTNAQAWTVNGGYHFAIVIPKELTDV